MTDAFEKENYYVPDFDISIDGTKLEPALLGRVSGLTVTKAIGRSDHISFDVADKLENGRFKYLGTDQFKYGRKISVALGYVGKKTLKAVSHILSVSPDFSKAVAPTFTVSGSHKAFAKLAARSALVTYQKKTAAQIVSSIAGTVGLSATTDSTGVTYEKTNKKNDLSNLLYIKYLASLNPTFEFIIDEETLYFRKAKITSAPVVTLNCGEDIQEFDPSFNLFNVLTKVVVRGHKDKEKVEGTAEAGSETAIDGSKTLGSTIAKQVFGENIKTITNLPVSTAQEAQEIAKAYLETATGEFVTGNGTVLGIPEIQPGVTIKIEGGGTWFTGKYYVIETTHTIDESGYFTRFKVRSNVL